ncbi:unnamed protein product [Cylindrotheca closterium]|uniref:Enoyl reductase (ER) domain-containing protein n=1 Tax=Cylindrotheca closterium TaxID=2856 RepID=A0AAD2CPP4_9STRA|nr:unnamed protein product [Cylindrotheca closterium]
MKAISFVDTKPQVVETGKPTLKEDEVLVMVHYSALDTALDPVIKKTFVGGMLHKQTDPLFCGWHFSGVVEAVGANVGDFETGMQVFGNLPYASSTTQGSLSEYITVKSDALAVKPSTMSMDLAAAATTEPLTALQSLRDIGKLPKGGHVLINGAGGQVGSCAVQIAKALGSEVTAIVSTKDVAKVTNLGATTVIDRKKTPNVMGQLKAEQFDVIFDTPGKLSARKITKYLKRKGVYVNPSPDDMLDFLLGKLFTLFSSKSVKMVMVESKKADLEQIGEWTSNSNLKIDIDSVHDVRDCASAIHRQNDSSKNGRVVIKVKGGF